MTGAAPSDSPDVMSASARGEAAALIGTWHVLARPVSRTDFRNLPLSKILIPTLDEPRLHFSGEAVARASVLDTRIDDLRPKYKRAKDALAQSHGESYQNARGRLTSIAKEARGLHLTRVVLADGFTWPELPYCWFLFEGEPDPYE